MARVQSVSTCRWGTPTLFLPWPLWFDAERCEWSCTRAAQPRPIPDPGTCEVCGGWTQPETRKGAPHAEDHLGSVSL